LASLGYRMLTDKDEWQQWQTLGDSVLHIELRKWADLMLVAPLDANTLGKLANGLCDNLVTCVARAWDVDKPLLVAPAMNTHMWSHPLTARNLAVLTELHYHIIEPLSQRLACGDIGVGAMAKPPTLFEHVVECLGKS
jgi:phosphopantothenoylcysteine decarboxylase